MKKIITVRVDGSMQFIYDDRLKGLMKHGQASIARVSHVEPGDPTKGQDPLRWFADMAPSGQPVVLGPFAERQQALAAEVEWINSNILTSPQTT